MRQRLLRLSSLLAAVLLLQWTVGMAGCVASIAAPGGPELAICHAEGGAVPRAPDAPASHDLAASICPLCVQLSATVLPEPSAALPGPLLAHVAAPLPDTPYGPVPTWSSPAHPARGPPRFS